MFIGLLFLASLTDGACTIKVPNIDLIVRLEQSEKDWKGEVHDTLEVYILVHR